MPKNLLCEVRVPFEAQRTLEYRLDSRILIPWSSLFDRTLAVRLSRISDTLATLVDIKVDLCGNKRVSIATLSWFVWKYGASVFVFISCFRIPAAALFTSLSGQRKGKVTWNPRHWLWSKCEAFVCYTSDWNKVSFLCFVKIEIYDSCYHFKRLKLLTIFSRHKTCQSAPGDSAWLPHRPRVDCSLFLPSILPYFSHLWFSLKVWGKPYGSLRKGRQDRYNWWDLICSSCQRLIF